MSQPCTQPHAYLRIAEGPEDLLGDQISLTRRLLTLFVAFVLFSGTSLFATAAFDLDKVCLGKAFAASGPGHDGTTTTTTTRVPAAAATTMTMTTTRHRHGQRQHRRAARRTPTTTTTATATRALTRARSA